jgi:CspA family cold shock protein
MSQRIFGVVKFYNEDKGYGFISPDGGGKDVFVHRSDLDNRDQSLEKDWKVSFVVGESDRKKGDGKKATSIKVESAAI